MTIGAGVSLRQVWFLMRLSLMSSWGRCWGSVRVRGGVDALAVALLGALLLAGCASSPSGDVTFRLNEDGQTLVLGEFNQVYWGEHRGDQVECVLVAGQEGAPTRRILVVRSFWLPHKGRTSLAESGTNLNIDLLVESEAQAGLYRGAGFGRLDQPQAQKALRFDIRSGALRLTGTRGAFVGRLDGAQVRGAARAAYAPARVRELADYVDEQRRTLR